MPNPLRPIVALLLLALAATSPAGATTQMQVDVGWDGYVRLGRWTPIQVTVTDPNTRDAVVEVAAPHDAIFSMRVRQHVGALGPQPKTFVLYVPANGYMGINPASSLAVVTRDAATGRVLARTADDDPKAFNRVQEVDGRSQFIGVTGRRTTLPAFTRTSVAGDQFKAGYLPPESLPATPVGYDALDLLVLDALDVAALTDEQQQALVDWVRAGGSLLLFPGTDPLPSASPLVDVLPCRLGGATIYNVPPDALKAGDLPARFGKLPGRTLEPVAEQSKPVPLIGGSVTAYRADLGLGRIVVSPVNLADLQSNDADKTYLLWTPATEGALDLAPFQGRGPGFGGPGFGPFEQRQSSGEQVVTDLLGDIPGAGRFGFSSFAIIMAGLMLVVGPVDWLVLRALKRQAWTWATTGGWIGLVTIGALYFGHVFKSGDLHYRTYTLVDQAGDAAVARTTYVGLYSPQSTEYTLEAGPAGWWEPLAAELSYDYVPRTGSELPFGQSYRGNTPLPMQANVWSLRFQKGTEYGAGPKCVDADLAFVRPGRGVPGDEGRVVGRIRNLTDRPLRNVRVVLPTAHAAAPDDVAVPPGGEAAIDAALYAAMPTDAQGGSPAVAAGQFRVEDDASDAADPPAVRAAVDLAAGQARAVDARLRAGGCALVIAEQVDPVPDVTLKENAGAIQSHHRVIRALVPLRRP